MPQINAYVKNFNFGYVKNVCRKKHFPLTAVSCAIGKYSQFMYNAESRNSISKENIDKICEFLQIDPANENLYLGGKPKTWFDIKREIEGVDAPLNPSVEMKKLSNELSRLQNVSAIHSKKMEEMENVLVGTIELVRKLCDELGVA